MSELPIDVLPRPQIQPRTEAVRSVYHELKRAFHSDFNRPLILHAHPGDRYELGGLCDSVFTALEIGSHRYVNQREIMRPFDVNPGPCIVLDGDNFLRGTQETFVRRYMNHPDFCARLLVITTLDPGELVENGAWDPEFRAIFYRTYRWPPLAERTPPDVMKILAEFLRKLNPELKRVRRGGVELFAKLLLPQEPTISTHYLLRAADHLVKEMEKAGVEEVTGTTINELVLKDALREMSSAKNWLKLVHSA